jgi:hypothetical protein
MKTQCMMIVVVPTDSPDISPVTYGTEEIGEVPSSALMEKATPNAIIEKPSNDMIIFLMITFLLLFIISITPMFFQRYIFKAEVAYLIFLLSSNI